MVASTKIKFRKIPSSLETVNWIVIPVLSVPWGNTFDKPADYRYQGMCDVKARTQVCRNGEKAERTPGVEYEGVGLGKNRKHEGHRWNNNS